MAVAVWWRKTWWLFPAALLIQLVVMQNIQPVGDVAPGWRVSWGWMLGVWNGGTRLLSPLMAAVAAMVMLRDWPQGMRGQIAPLPRGRASYRHILAVLYLQGLAVMLVSLAVGAALCASHGAPIESATLPWQLFTGPAALLAAVVLGMLSGCLVKDIWVVPLLGFGVFLVHQVFFWSGYPELFTTEIPSWYYEDARPKATHLLATIGLNLAVAVGLWCVLDWVTRVEGLRPRVLLAAAGLCLATALAIYLPWVIAGNMDTYELIR